MSGADGSNELWKRVVPAPLQLEHLVWGRTGGQATSNPKAGEGQVPSSLGIRKIMEMSLGSYQSTVVTLAGDMALSHREEPLPYTGGFTPGSSPGRQVSGHTVKSDGELDKVWA